MKRIFLTLFLVTAVLVQAQPTAKEAKALLEASSKKMKSLGAYRISFQYNLVNTRVSPPVKQQENGSIVISGDAYKFNFLGTEQFSDGKKVYTILREDEEVQITPVKKGESGGALSPSKILDMYQSGYSYKLDGEEKLPNGQVIQYVVLKPMASETLDHAVVGIKKSDKTLYSYMEKGTNGTETKFTITKLEANLKLAPATFLFKESDYPGFYISK